MSDKYKELNWREKVGKPKRKKKQQRTRERARVKKMKTNKVRI